MIYLIVRTFILRNKSCVLINFYDANKNKYYFSDKKYSVTSTIQIGICTLYTVQHATKETFKCFLGRLDDIFQNRLNSWGC